MDGEEGRSVAGSGPNEDKDPFDGVVFDDEFVKRGISEAAARAGAPPAKRFGRRWRRPAIPDGVVPLRRPARPTRSVPPLRQAFGLSWIFIGLVAAFVAAGIGSWSDDGSRIAVFAFVVFGWLISLCLHEFSHAAVAYRGGDHSVAIKGYLSLDIRRYANPFLSFVLPALIVLIGGIGLPGGAVWIDHATLRTRLWRCVVSLAGPAANFVCALACVIPFAVGNPTAMVLGNHSSFWAGVAFLGLLQLYAVFLNLLPVPGLDGWGAAEPYLPPNVVETGRKISPFGIMIVFFVVVSSPALGGHIRSFLDSVEQAFGVPGGLAAWGYHLMRFWSRN